MGLAGCVLVCSVRGGCRRLDCVDGFLCDLLRLVSRRPLVVLGRMIDELGVTEGRAYHAGDVVLLRSKAPLREQDFQRISASLELLSEKSRVIFVMLDDNIEVVEPREVVEGGGTQ